MAETNGDDPKLKSGPKGINTAESSDDILNLKEIPGLNYRQYKDPQTQQAASLATIATTPARTAFIGNTLIDKKTYNKLAYVPVDLARAIPDKTEREAFIADSGSKLVKLASPEQYGVVFDHQLGDASKFAEANYHKEFKKFLDELKDSQNWAEKFAANAVKLVGRTATGVTGILPVVWGLGKALLTLDSKAILNNSVMDAWEAADAAIDKQTVVYGGYDYYFNPDGSPKDENVFGKFAINPMKAFNETVAPAVGFVASAIISELAWTAATATTFGGAAVGLAANTARIMAQGTRLFGGAARAVMPKSILALRGLDQLSDLQKAAQLADLTNKYRAGIGMATSMVRSAGYESALIGRDTQRSAYDEMIKAHVENTGEQPTAQEEEYYAEKANDQGLLAFSLNVPLVGVSNMLQFTKAFASGYKISQTAARLNPLNLAGTTVGKAGNLIAKADKVGRLGRFAGYSTAVLADGITEGAEEFVQGALQYGLADYAAANYSKGAVKDSVGYLAAITNAARNFAGTTEGFDSIAIGGLMGMVGLRLPIKLDTDTGKYKFSLKGTAFGGAASKYRDVKQDIEKARNTAKIVNDAPVNQNLKDNFANMARNFNTQQEMDDAVARGDIFTYKNLEHKDFHSYVSTRYNAGLVDTIYQEIEAARKIPLDVFNKQYAPSGVVEFTEETRKKALDQFEKSTRQVEKAHKEVELVFNDRKHFVDFFNKNYLGVRDPFGALEGVKDQLTYLHSFESNLSSREKDLQDKVRDLSAGNIDPSVVDEIIAEVGIKPNSKEKNANIKTTARETYRAALAEWKSRDPKGYNKYVEEVKPLLKDLIEIKSKGIQTSELYRFLSTKQGADKFAIFYDNLLNQAKEQAKKEAERVAAEELKKAKSTEKTKKAAADEFSATGATKNFDAKVDQELEEATRATREALQGVPGAEAFTDSEAMEAIDSDYVVRTLENSPALFAEITERLSAKGTPLPISSIDQLDDALASDPMLTVKIAAELAALAKENSSKKEYTKEKPTFADPEDASQPSPSADDLEVGDRSKYVEEAKVLSDLFQVGQNVSDQAIIPILYDKELERNKNTGRFEEKGKDPIDRKKVNSAEFLNNKDLLENVREAELRVMDNDYNKGNVTADDVAIGVYYGDTFLGLLPRTNPNSPANFKALREAVYKNYLGEAIEGETTTDKQAEIIEINNNRNRNKEQKNAGAPILDGYSNAWFAYYTPEGPENRVSFKTQQEALNWIDSKYDAELDALSKTTADNKAQIDDIERRRRLSKIVDLDTGVSDDDIRTTQPEPGVQVTYYLPKGKTTDGRNISEIPSGSIERYTTETRVFYGFEEAEQQAKDWIKSKYDAELDALKGTATNQAEIERRQRVADIITTQLELGVELPKILETLAEQGYVEKINNSAFFKQSTGRDAIVFNIDGAIVPIYRSSQGTSSKTKGEWYPFFFNGGDWLVKGGADSYKDGYNNPIIKQILDALNKNYKYDKPIATAEGNNEELLALLPLGGLDIDVSYEENSGIYDYINYAAIAIILKDWQSKLGNIDVTGYQEYLNGASSSLIKANPTLKSEIQSGFNEASKLFAELAALKQPKTASISNIERIEIPRYFTFGELGGKPGKKAGETIETERNAEIQENFEKQLKEGDKLIEPNGDVFFYKNGKVVKPNGQPRGPKDIGAFINGVTIERNAELATLEGTQTDINLTADKVLEVLTETSKKFGIVELNKDNSENIDQEYIVQQIKDTLNTLGLPYKDVVAIRKSTYNVINSKGESIEILKLLQMGGAPLPAKITAAKYLNSLTKEEKINYAKKQIASSEGTTNQAVSPATTEKIEALSKELTTLENTLTDLESELEAAEQELNSPDSKQNQSIDKIIEEDVTEEELNAVIAEENLADQQEAKEKIKEEVKTQLNNKGKITPKTTLQKIASRIKKAVLKILIVATLLNGTSFTFSPSAKAKDYQNASIENLKSFEDVKLAQDELNKLDNINTITEFNKDKTGKYLIVDKNAAMAHLFDGDSLVASYEVGTGKEKGDEQTKTVVKNGKVYWEEGNKQTGAGIYDINSVGKYKSSAAYTLKNEQGLEVSTVLHETLSNRKKLFKDNNPSNNRMSFGCVNFQAQSLQDLSKNHKDFAAGSKVYILPDNPLNEFKVEDGKLVFKSTDAKVNRSKRDYKFEPITMKANTSSDANKVVLQTLADSKQKLMGLYPTVSNDIYNQIAKLAYGIFGQESSFGSYGGPRGQVGRVTDFAQLVSNYVFNSNYNPSVGITQLRYSNIREELKQIFKINSANDLLDNEKATQATMGLLLDIYVNEIPDNKKEDFEKLIPLAYSNRTEYTKALKDPKAYKNAYVENVINNAKEAKVYLGINESSTKPIKTKSSQKGNILFGFGLLALVRRRKNNEEVSDEEIESAKSKTVKELDKIKSRLKEITQELQELKNPPTRESVINKNFDKIIEQLAKSGYNIFFNEDKIFKKC